MKRRTLLLNVLLILALALAVSPAVFAQPNLEARGGRQIKESPNGIYIVQMINQPAVAYRGDIPGLKATRPSQGEQIDPNDADVVKYVAYLNGRHSEALSRAGGENSTITVTVSTGLLPG